MLNVRRREAFRNASRSVAILALLLGATGEVALGQSLDWAKRAGGPNFDQGLAIATDEAGDSWVTGFFTGSATFGTGDANETTLTADLRDVFVAKYDPTGALVWVRQARGADPSHGQGNAISVDAAGNSYVTGVFRFAITFDDTTTLSEDIPGVTELFVAKYDVDGNFLWARKAGLNFIPDVVTVGKAGNGISADSAGNSHVTGVFGTELGEAAFFVARFDTNGLLLWAKHARNDGINPSSAGGSAISVDGLANSHVTGNLSGSVTFGPGEVNETTLTAEGGTDVFAAKYDSSGNLLWAKRAGGTSAFVAGNGIDVDTSGSAVIAGDLSGSVTFGLGEPGETTLAGSGILVAKFDNDGNLVWAKLAPGSAAAYAVSVDAAGNSHITGLFGFLVLGAGETNETTLTTSAIFNEAFVAKYDSSGALLWARQTHGPYAAGGRGVSVDGTGASYVAGIFGNVGGNAGDPTSVIFGLGEANETTLTTAPASGTEIFLARFGDDPTQPNHPPVAHDQSVTTPEDTAVAIALSANDQDGDTLTYSIVDFPIHGVLSGTLPDVIYTPHPNYNGPDAFTFRASDGTDFSNVATVTITVLAVNDPPVPENQTVSTPQDVPVAITLRASDVDGDPLTFDVVDLPTHGTLTGSGPARTYTPQQGYAGPDSFTFRAFDPTVASALGLVTLSVEAASISCGALISGTIGAAGEVDGYTFFGQAGQIITLALASTGGFATNQTSTSAALTLFAPSGAALGGLRSNSLGNFTLPATGTYVVRVSAVNLVRTGSYNFSLHCLLPVPTPAPTLQCGALQVGTLTAPADLDLYAFTGQAGQIVTLALASTSGFATNQSSTSAGLTLFAPSGAALGSLRSNSLGNFTLPATGTYVVRVSAVNLARTGSYNVGFHCLFPPSPGTPVLQCGALQSGTIGAPGEVDLYSFTGQAGQIVTLALASTSGFATNQTSTSAGLTLFAPSGAALGSLRSNSLGNFTLPATGTYVVRVNAVNLATTGSYNVSFHCLFPPSPGTPVLQCGALQSGTIGAPGEIDLYAFTGQAGQIVTLALASTGGFATNQSSTSAGLTLFAPSGAALGSFRSNSLGNFTLPTTGTYVVRVNAVNLATTGSYNVSFNCLVPPSPGTLVLQCGALQSGTIGAPGEIDLYAFTGQAGQIVTLTLASTGGFATNRTSTSAGLTLFAPSGAALGSFRSNSQGNFTLPATGTYVVRVSAVNLATTGSYDLRLVCPS